MIVIFNLLFFPAMVEVKATWYDIKWKTFHNQALTYWVYFYSSTCLINLESASSTSFLYTSEIESSPSTPTWGLSLVNVTTFYVLAYYFLLHQCDHIQSTPTNLAFHLIIITVIVLPILSTAHHSVHASWSMSAISKRKLKQKYHTRSTITFVVSESLSCPSWEEEYNQ